MTVSVKYDPNRGLIESHGTGAGGINLGGSSITGVFSGSLTTLADGSSYLVQGAGIGITSGSNGAITISNLSNSDIATTVPAPNSIPRSKSDGTLDHGWLPRHTRLLTVCIEGTGDYLSVNEAIAAVTDATAEKPYVITIHPGVYVEAPFTMKPYVSIVGVAPYGTVVLQTTNNAVNFITGAVGSVIQNIMIDGPTGVGTAAIYYEETGEDETQEMPFYIVRCVIRTAYYGVWINPPDDDPVGSVRIYELENFDNGTTIQNLIRLTGYAKADVQNLAIRTQQVIPTTPSVVQGIHAEGPHVQLILQVWLFNDPLCTDVLYVNGGASVRLSSLTVNEALNVIHVGPDGASVLELSSVVIHAETALTHLWVESPTAIVHFTGAGDKSKGIIEPGAHVSAQFTDATPGEEGTVVYGELWLGTPESTIPMRSYGLDTFSTGFISGGELVKSGSLTLTVNSGSSYINTGATIKNVTWPKTDILLTSGSSEWIYVDGSGTVQHTNTEPNDWVTVELARTMTGDTDIGFVAKHRFHLDQSVPRINAYLADALGPISVSGGNVTTHANPSLKVDVVGGTYYISLDIITFSLATPATFTKWYRKAVSGWNFVSGQTDIDPGFYDDGTGTLHALTPGKYKKDIFFAAVYDGQTEFHLVYGQQEFDSQLEAETGNYPASPDLLTTHACRLAGLVTLSGSDTIASSVDARARIGQSITNTPFVTTNHASLSNLDFASSGHTGFEAAINKGSPNGYAALNSSGTVSQNPANATNTPTLGKIPIADGSGKLDGWITDATSSAKGKVQLTDTAGGSLSASDGVPGTSTEVSRQDHTHTILVGTPATIGSTNNTGSLNTLARADHIHNHGNQTAGTHHAVVISNGTSGFMSGSDKAKLDGIAAGATNVTVTGVPVNVDNTTASSGSAATAAKSDHKHAVNVASPGTGSLGTTPNVGAQTTLALSDHIHQSNTAPVNVTKATAAIGTSVEPARADHKHDVATAAPVSIGYTNTEGTATSLARSDHVHNHSSYFTQTSTITVGLGSTAEALLTDGGVGTVTLPANFFTVGKSIRISADGTMNRQAGNVTFRVRLGGLTGTIIFTTAAHNPGAGVWRLPPTIITCRTTGNASTGSVIGNSYMVENLVSVAFTANATAVLLDTTIAQDVALTAQWSNNNVANAYTVTNLVIESL